MVGLSGDQASERHCIEGRSHHQLLPALESETRIDCDLRETVELLFEGEGGWDLRKSCHTSILRRPKRTADPSAPLRSGRDDKGEVGGSGYGSDWEGRSEWEGGVNGRGEWLGSRAVVELML